MTIHRYFALGLAWLSLATCAFSQPPGQDARALAAFKDALNRDGFDWNSGAAIPMNFVAAWCADQLPSWFPYDHALYANTQPYLGLRVPKSQAPEPPLQQTPFFQLGPQEAIVLIGQTPPPERYFGFYPYLFSKVMPDGKRQSLFVTLGDAVNNATVKTTGATPFSSPMALIFTPDQGTDARIRKALERSGYPAAIVNTVVFPASMLNLGHGDAADELMILMRNSMWQPGAEAAGDAYINNPPLSILRVTPRTEAIANPLPVPRLRVRGTGQTEVELMNKLGTLRQRIIAANPGLYPKDIVTQVGAYEGYDYIQRGIDPWGDARDTIYLAAGYAPDFGATKELTLAGDEFLMVYGTNHVATGKASYHSFTVYSSKVGKVPLGTVEDPKFSDSAKTYLYDDPAAAKLMYAFKVAWSCGEGETNCVPLRLLNCPKLEIGPATVMGVFFRMYLEPATKVGPAMPEILYDRVIKFSPRPQAQP